MKRRLVSAVLSTVFLITGVISVSGCASKKSISKERLIEYFEMNKYHNSDSRYHFEISLPNDYRYLDRYLFGGYDSLLVFENNTGETQIQGFLCEYKSGYRDWYYTDYKEAFGVAQSSLEESLAETNLYYSDLDVEGGYHISERQLSVIYGENKIAGVKYFLEVEPECIVYILADKENVLVFENNFQGDYSIDNGYNALNEYCSNFDIYAPNDLIADSKYKELEKVQSEWWKENGAEVERLEADMRAVIEEILSYT